MSAFSGPEISTSGLIFCYDMNNTEKSWTGKPTTNLYDFSFYQAEGGHTATRTVGDAPGLSTSVVDYHTITTASSYASEANRLLIWPATALSPSTTYRVSFWARVTSKGSTTIQSAFYGNAANNTHNLTSLWQRFSYSSTTHSAYRALEFGSSDGAITFQVAGIQWEVGAFETPYTKTSRSNTQAILDLTNNNTITAQNLSYASDGTFSFDATDDYIDTGLDLSWNNTNSASIDFWCKPSTLSQTRGIIGKGLDWEWQVRQNGSNLGFVYWDTGGSHGNGPTPEVSSVFQANVWKNITVVWSHTANQLYLYANGVLISTNTWTNASTNVNKSNSVKIGGSIYDWTGGGAYWSGSISNVKFYNLALSAQEVAQNFQAYRGRYGI